jgi:hypothetical protein
MRFLAIASALLFSASLASCSGPGSGGVDALGAATHEDVANSYANAIAEGMARARAERVRELATSMGRRS